MEYLTKSNALLLLLVLGMTGCFTNKALTKKEPVSRQLLSQLKPGKTYVLELHDGPKMKIHINAISAVGIDGYSYQRLNKNTIGRAYFSDSFEEMERKVDRISRRKFNPFLTAACVVVPVGLVILILNIEYEFTISLNY